VSAARIATTLEETNLFPDVREAFERALKVTYRKKGQLLRVMVNAWLAQWEAAGSPSDYLGYKRSPPWDTNTLEPYVRNGRAGGTLADVVLFRPRLVPGPPAGGAA
jgi:phosphoribosylaminoimidazole-succinocarboxamide synthase